MEIWDYHLVRIAGLPFNLLDDLCLDHSVVLIKNVIDLENEIASNASSLADKIFILVQAAGDDKIVSRKCINLRRDVFNARNVKAGDVESVSHLLDEGLASELQELLTRQCKLRELQNELEVVIKKEKAKATRSFKKILLTEEFKSGLLLGSSTLYSSLEQYISGQVKDDRKWEGEELGLIKYLTRALAKTSPFSTFTSLGLIAHGGSGKTRKVKLVPVKKSLIRLNNKILKALLNVLWQYLPFYRQMRLRLNYTIYNNRDNYTFVLNTNSNNNEAFQKIAKQPILDFIYNRLLKKKSLAYKRLLDELEQVVQAPVKELIDFIDSLISYGFLEYEIEVSGMDPEWCSALIGTLKHLLKIEDDIALRNLVVSLEIIQDKYREYELSDSSTRPSLLDEILSAVYDGYIGLHKAAGLPEYERTAMEQFRSLNKIRSDIAQSLEEQTKGEDRKKQKILETTLIIDRRAILYEDTSSRVRLNLDMKNIEKTIETLNLINSELHFANIFQDSRERIKNFFLKKYEKDQQISILNFYREFSGNKVNKEFDTFARVGHDLRGKWMDSFSNLIKDRDLNRPVVHISMDDITRVSRDLGVNTQNSISRSYSAFFQTSYDKETDSHMSVVNGVMVGYGKFASRFLGLFDRNLTTYFRDKNSGLMNDAVFAEHNDSSFFNANMHPPLFSNEIVTTGNQTVMKSKDFIRIQNIDVGYSEQDDEVYLKDRTSGRKVINFDLGFQSPVSRSAFFNFLTTFTHSSVPDYELIVASFYESYEKSVLGNKEWTDEFIVYPRLCINDNIVLTRRRWRIHPRRLPSLSKADDFNTKLKTIWMWKTKHDVPDEFFVTYSPEAVNQVELSRKDGKPQYINLHNPFLITLFSKFILRGTTLSIEEMLPTPDNLHKDSYSNRFVSEILVHWNS